jgi:hypothetical protein
MSNRLDCLLVVLALVSLSMATYDQGELRRRLTAEGYTETTQLFNSVFSKGSQAVLIDVCQLSHCLTN